MDEDRRMILLRTEPEDRTRVRKSIKMDMWDILFLTFITVWSVTAYLFYELDIYRIDDMGNCYLAIGIITIIMTIVPHRAKQRLWDPPTMKEMRELESELK